ncbi:MAG TPA: molybdenum cofactor guanylyltransferase [Proteobacteria bacterium]|nr:putative molybdenum cofactor guanylyltransferase [bacterium BMS3Abin14]HDL53843.1 molybdenum cofactor guanylyltransferase [Pseudomonadota bacterium]
MTGSGVGRTGNITGVVLAGGKSLRMGRDKILLPIEGSPLIAHILRRMSSIFPEVLVVGHHRPEFEALGINTHPDIIPDSGVLGGLYTGLILSKTPFIFAAAGDMPFLDPDLIIETAALREGNDAVVPRGPKGLEPLFAVYSRSCLEPFLKRIEQRRLKVMEALDGMKVASPEIGPGSSAEKDPFTNINTLDDMAVLGSPTEPD